MSTTQEVLQQDLKKLLNSGKFGNNPNMPTTLLAHQKNYQLHHSSPSRRNPAGKL